MKTPQGSEPRPDVEIADNPDAGRYELRHDGEVVGVVVYRREAGSDSQIVTIPHVEVIPRLRGGGHSAPFLDQVLDLFAAEGARIRPLCGYAATHIRQRPDRDELLA